MEETDWSPRTNPFSTRFHEPGALGFLFSDGDSAERLLERFIRFDGCAQIVGPHGSGKTTLLRTLMPLLAARFPSPDPREIALHDGQRRLPEEFWSENAGCRNRLVVIDGYEQLSFFERLRLRCSCRRLLVTTHRAAWRMPVLCREVSSPDRFVRLVRLLHADPVFKADEELRSLYRAHHGNCRDAFFELYEEWETSS
ncbi:MAG TPA: hypothetical protein DEB39_12540 [Planctomycetaceae bacterium]|nr:hypothetical protein [Planctomycetaceae bacterium]